MSQQSIYNKTITVMNQIWNTQGYDFDMPTIYTAALYSPNLYGGVFHDGSYYTSVSKYGNLYTESNTSTISPHPWYSGSVVISAPTIIMPDWVENWWQGELYAEYYIYHEVAHAINFGEGTADDHAANYHVILENIVKDSIEAGYLPANALELFEGYEESYSNNYGKPISQNFIAEILSDLDDAETAINNATNLAELEAAADSLDDIPQSLVIETEINLLQDAADLIIDAGDLWISENNPHEAGTLRAERWEAIQRGDDTSKIETEMLLGGYVDAMFDLFSGDDDEITEDEAIEAVKYMEDYDAVTPVTDSEILEVFREFDKDLNGILDYDEFSVIWDGEFEGITITREDIDPFLLDLDIDLSGSVKSNDLEISSEWEHEAEVDISDAIDILREIVGLEELNDYEFVLADANRDGVVNISDAITTLRVIVDLTTIDEVAADAFVPSLDFA